ncbi:MAG TPA: hypothetical protein VFX59_23405 [Polyangiales bacterium]|nr:hypothetical protein [Polyangiales bacterium]
MSAAGSVSVDELVRSLDRKSSTLPAEIAAFIAFSGAESMLEQGPRELTGLSQVRVNENGNVVLHGPACEEAPGARSLHRVLVSMLQASSRNLPPALQRLRDRPESELSSLRSLLDQLEATLVPLNRTASRRVLARFAREAAHPLIDDGAVDDALSSLLGEEQPANDGRRARSLEPDARPLQVDLLEGLDLDGDEHYLETKVSAPSRLSDFDGATSARPSVRPSLSPGRPSTRSQASGLEELGSPSSSRKLFLGFALVAAAVLVVIVATSIRDENARQDLLQAEAAAAKAELKTAPSANVGDLLVHVSEPNAQVLRYVGRAPVSIDKLPVGVAHEFVASAEGHQPTRALVPANAEWEATAEGARYELAMQLDEGNDALELGPSRLTAQGSAKGTGTIRVITTPRSARVYQLIGFSPDVKVENVPLDGPQELLIYRDGFAPVLRGLQPSDFTPRGDKRVADVTIELKKKRQ